MTKKNSSKVFIFSVLSGLFLCIFSSNHAMAQEITDQQLYEYAILEETLTLFQSELSAQITEYVEKQDPAIKNRYNALAGGEAPANDTEKQFMANVTKMQDERGDEFKNAYLTMIKRVLGGQTYNAVKKALASDSAVKERYAAIVSKIQSASGGA